MNPADPTQHPIGGSVSGNSDGKGRPLAGAAAARSVESAADREGADRIGLRTQGVIESGVCEIMTVFVRQILGRGPTEVRAFVVEDMILVRLKGTLTAAEKHLSTLTPAEKGRDLVKGVRSQLLEGSECQLRHLIEHIVECRCLAIHHDLNTITGEQMFVFTLEGRPSCRDAKARRKAGAAQRRRGGDVRPPDLDGE